ncbi:MAG: 3'-5' exonuclease [Pirellulales bacterium]|nr:3'-5' exonuclease [Thermoguttaceae bacterium]MDD4786273.1 3'-5' exonuclease [Pirellulales bacterium]MDI9443243.1 3'-5' exonuclease [Planctomycetota bacterium]
MSDHLLEGLNPAQREAVSHIEGPLLILAGPGSGKTRVVTHRIAWLLEHGVAPARILALTFTNKAAEEMRSRVERLVPGHSVWVSTYHRFAARLLRRHAGLVGLEENYTIYDADMAGRALRRAIERARIDPAMFNLDQIRSRISWLKSQFTLPDDYEPRPGYPLGEVVRRVYPAYQALLAQSNAVDFDDLLLHAATILRDCPEIRRSLDERHQFVLVDEYQDTNRAQYIIARALSIDYPNLAVTGDPDQSIYGWRGAHVGNILEFENDYPQVRVVRLEQNYRSTKSILRAADELIARNLRRKKKRLFTENAPGPPVRLVIYGDQNAEARAIAERIAGEVASGRRRPRQFAVFYRINALSLPFERAFRELGVPYQLVQGMEFFQRKEIRDVLAYLQVIHNPRDDETLLRVINTPARGIGRTTIERLAEHGVANGLSLLDAARDRRAIGSLNKRAVGQVGKFVDLIDRLAALADAPMEEILGHVLTETGYKEQYANGEGEEDQQRLANIEELLTVAREFDERHAGEARLDEFLEETSLVGDTDDWEAESDRVTLMTLHASKGLEFPVVFLVAVEEGLLPHERAHDNADQVEEERRLMFVGITRAREELQISHAFQRDFRGQRKITIPSRFLMDLPRAEMEMVDRGGQTPGGGDWPTAPEPSPAATFRSRPSIRLTTAAELAGDAALPTVAPDEFTQDMIVRHNQFGLGRIAALSGSGATRTATVDFIAPPERRRFVLSKGELRPLKLRPLKR